MIFRKILIIRFSSIGDLVLITPVLRCIKLQLNSEIHLIVKEKFQSVLQSNPHITRTWSFNNSLSEVVDDLKKESFDLIIDLHYNFRSIYLSMVLGKPVLRFNKLNIQKWLMTQFKINVLPKKHLVDRYFEALISINIKNDEKGLDYYIPGNAMQKIHDMHLPSSYIVAVLGATYYTKQIPLVKWLEMIRQIELPVALIGGNQELQMAAELSAAFPQQVINCTGLLSIPESAALIKNSVRIITPDTGMMHIAAALRKIMNVVWGNTIPDFGMYPYFGTENSEVHYHEVTGLSCRPCSKLGYSACPKKHFKCMLHQPLDNKFLQI